MVLVISRAYLAVATLTVGRITGLQVAAGPNHSA